MTRYLWRTMTLGLAAGFLLSGCDGSGATTGPGPAQEPVGLLRKVSNADELEASIKTGFTAIQSTDSLDTTTGVSSGAPSAGTYSRTYTQEIDVDEFDSVKYDGEYLFIAPTRQHFPCCFLAEEPSGGSSAPVDDNSIRIFQTDPATAGAVEVGTIPLADEISVQGLYRTDDRIVAMTSRVNSYISLVPMPSGPYYDGKRGWPPSI